MKTERRKLKSLAEIVDIHWTGNIFKGYRNQITGAFINASMINYFGDKKRWSFSPHRSPGIYTHSGPEGYSYNEDWFVEEEHLDEELFEI